MSKPATVAYLERVALHYLERYPGSTARVRRTLEKRVAASVAEHGTDPAEGRAAIDAVLAKLTRMGLLDDARFATSRVRSLRARGKSARMIRMTLQRQGIAPARIDAALGERDPDDELSAAIAMVRKRRLGRSREERAKDLAKLGRAGFSYDVAKRALERAGDE